MAKLIVDDSMARPVRVSYIWWHIGIIGIGAGIAYYVLTLAIGHFVVDPLFCRSAVNLHACSNSVALAGNISAILVATTALGVLVRLRVYRPIVIVAASAITLWGLAGWTNGLSWIEVLGWSALCYGLSYVLFSWLSRYTRTVPVLISVLVIVIIARLLLSA
jgi:hypothetical protein